MVQVIIPTLQTNKLVVRQKVFYANIIEPSKFRIPRIPNFIPRVAGRPIHKSLYQDRILIMKRRVIWAQNQIVQVKPDIKREQIHSAKKEGLFY